MAGITLIVVPTVVFGGFSVLTLLVHDPTYADNARSGRICAVDDGGERQAVAAKGH